MEAMKRSLMNQVIPRVCKKCSLGKLQNPFFPTYIALYINFFSIRIAKTGLLNLLCGVGKCG
jgi:hypothetical protein